MMFIISKRYDKAHFVQKSSDSRHPHTRFCSKFVQIFVFLSLTLSYENNIISKE